MTFSRTISPNEKSYLAIRSLVPPFAIQLVFSAAPGSAIVNEDRLSEAVHNVGDFIPGTRLVARGGLWVDSGISPPVVAIPARHGEDDNDVNAPWTRRPLHPRAGPTCELLILEDSNSLVFRAFHGVMDGKGVMLWAENVFRALRGEPLIRCESRETDWDLVRRIMPAGTQSGNVKPKDPDMAWNVGKPNGEMVFARISVKGSHSALIAKFAGVLAGQTDVPEAGLRFLVPVDMRRHDSRLATESTGNLTMPIFLDVHPNQRWETLQRTLLGLLSTKAELQPSGMESLAQFTPRRALKHAIRLSDRMSRQSNKNIASGFLSHLGRLRVEDFAFSRPNDESSDTSNEWRCASAWSLPTPSPMMPLCVTMLETGRNVEIVAAIFNDKASKREEWLHRVLKTVATELEQGIDRQKSESSEAVPKGQDDHQTPPSHATLQMCPTIASPYNAPTPLLPEASMISEVIRNAKARGDETPAVLYRQVDDPFVFADQTDSASSIYSTMSFADLLGHARRLAQYLHGRYMAPGAQGQSSIAIWLPRTPSAVISILATWMLGYPFVPLDPEHPDERVSWIIGNAESKVVLTDSTGCRRLQSMDLQTSVVNVEAGIWNSDPEFGEGDSSATWNQAKGTDVAYIIYTSGSSGKPKGVLVSHSNVLAYLQSVNQLYTGGNAADYRYVLFTPLSFDLSITCLLLPLLTGGSIVLIKESGLPGVRRALQDRPAHRGNAIKLTPTHIDLAYGLDVARAPEKDLWKLAVIGGENLQISTLRKLRSLLGAECTIVNEYGPTEATVGCVVKVVSPLDYADEGPETPRSVPIGLPLGGTSVRLVEPNSLDSVPAGRPGEMVIFGPQVAQGYIGVDSTSFFQSPDGQRGYRTGDLAAWVPASTEGESCEGGKWEIAYLGRIDKQVKISGYRVEVDEIAAILDRCSLQDIYGDQEDLSVGATLAFEQAVVTAAKSTPRGGASDDSETVLVTYVVPSQALPPAWSSITPPQVKAFLRRRLPKHMVPAVVVVVPNIPVTINGKLDVSGIPWTLDVHEATPTESETPSSDFLSVLQAVWATVLSTPVSGEMVQKYDYHELGGDSLSLLRMLQLLEARIRTGISDEQLPQPAAPKSALSREKACPSFFEICVENGVLEKPSFERLAAAAETYVKQFDLMP
ncbi:hypothetical protein HDU87_008775 [Geranomyces variabilis]|uniref:Carrier domain-containing protein n=1 Tax=Geranomyces variabilis TaxID=109894 RepID=A0AAD5TE62_9FUNG|nr:hypothetical protein HDU87_008775 [Geranomyces variabilis]